MVKVICAKTGIEFEAESKRQKNHPRISALLSQAHHDGWYGPANNALAKGKEDGLTTIQEFIDYMYEARDAHLQNREANYTARKHEERAAANSREAAREARAVQNALLREHGYKWSKGYSGFDAYEETGPDVWELWSDDNREVSVEQALAEIARGKEVVLAEIATKEAAKAQAEVEEQLKAQAEKEAVQLEREKFLTAVAEMEARCQMVEWPSFQPKLADPQLVARATRYGQYSDRLYRGNVNGVESYELQVGEGYDDDGRHTLWCTDPQTAGLKPKVEKKSSSSSLERTYSEFFGIR